jgi:glycosyltransferase involved in cell wall biosynthesis
LSGDRVHEILQVVTDTDRRGAQVFAVDLHDAFTRLDVRVRTVALAPGAVGGLDLPVLGTRRLGPDTMRALRRELRDATIVVAHGSSTLPAAALATLFTSRPFVYRQISDSMFWASSRARQARVRWGLSRASRVVALWDGSAATLEANFGVGPAKVSVVPNGVPASRFSPVAAGERPALRERFGLAPGRPTLLTISALAHEKGVDLAIDAVGEVPDAQLLVVGDGPERAALEARSRAVAGDRIAFAGSLPDPRDAYGAADLVVFPTRGGDSMPAVLIEAGMMTLPAIATPVGAIPQVVLDQQTGVIVPTDSVPALVSAIGRLVEQPAVADAFGAAARTHCLASFDIDVVARQWLEVLRSVPS